MLEMEITLTVPPAFRKGGRLPRAYHRELRRGVERSVARVKAVAVRKAPTNFGALRKSLASREKFDNRTATHTGEVFSPLVHSVVMELGADPFFPPVAPLVLWARRKRLAWKSKSGKPLSFESIAFLVARGISRKGIKGRHYLRDSFVQETPRIVAILRDAHQKGLDEIARGSR